MDAASSLSPIDGGYPPDLSPEVIAYIEHLVDARVEDRLRTMGEEPLWDIKEVAAYLNVSKRLCETLCATAELQPIWIGGVRRFLPEAVRDFVRNSAKKGRRGRRKF